MRAMLFKHRQITLAAAAGMLLICQLVHAQDVESVLSAPIFTLTGALGANAEVYSSSGIEERKTPFSWTLSGSLVPTLKSFSMPVSFVFSEKERSLSRQPYNVAGLSPSLKWATLHLGYRSMNFSKYTLAGKQFFGAGIELKPGPVRFGAMYGRFERAIESDSTDPLNRPTYALFGYAVQAGYDQGWLKALVSWLHATDDTASLKNQLTDPDQTPQENNAFGVEVGLGIIPNRLRLEIEGGGSIYTRDITSSRIDPDSAQLPAVVGELQDIRYSTTLTIASRIGLNLTFPRWGVRLGFERIEPEYRSLGAHYFNTDIQNITVAPRFRFGTLNLSGSIGIGQNNVLGQRAVQTNRLIGSLMADWQTTKAFGISLNGTNYSTGQSAGRGPVNDTIAVRNVSRSLSVAPRLILANTEKSHSFNLAAGYQDFTDLNAFTNQTTDYSSITSALGYNLAFLKSGASIGAGLSATSTESATGLGSTVLGVSLNGGTTLFAKDLLSLNGSLGVSRVSTTGLLPAAINSTVLNESMTASLRITEADQIMLTGWATQSSAGGRTPDEGFSEIGARLGYSRNFNIINVD